MAKADRFEKFEQQRISLEAEYHAALLAALRATAAGKWGLFAHKKDKGAIAATAPIIEELDDLAAASDAQRAKLMMEPFSLHPKFMASRGPVDPSHVGEPKQAQTWIDRLETSRPPLDVT